MPTPLFLPFQTVPVPTGVSVLPRLDCVTALLTHKVLIFAAGESAEIQVSHAIGTLQKQDGIRCRGEGCILQQIYGAALRGRNRGLPRLATSDPLEGWRDLEPSAAGKSTIITRICEFLPSWEHAMKKRRRMRGRVEKVLKPVNGDPEKAQIHVTEAEELYREVRVENELTDPKGNKARLKPGAEVDVVIEADSSQVTPKKD